MINITDLLLFHGHEEQKVPRDLLYLLNLILIWIDDRCILYQMDG